MSAGGGEAALHAGEAFAVLGYGRGIETATIVRDLDENAVRTGLNVKGDFRGAGVAEGIGAGFESVNFRGTEPVARAFVPVDLVDVLSWRLRFARRSVIVHSLGLDGPLPVVPGSNACPFHQPPAA